jgi:hypothetical protein
MSEMTLRMMELKENEATLIWVYVYFLAGKQHTGAVRARGAKMEQSDSEGDYCEQRPSPDAESPGCRNPTTVDPLGLRK